MSFTRVMRQIITRGKDTSTEVVMGRIWNRYFEQYGRMLNFSIDSLQKKAHLEILLKGEREPITLTVGEYELLREGGQTFLVIRRASASREWMTCLLQDFVLNKKLPVPAKYAQVLGVVL